MQTRKRSLFVTIIALLIFSTSFSFYTHQSNALGSSLGQVNINSNAIIKLMNVQLMPYNEQQTLAATVTFENNGSKEIAFVDYWIKFKLANGSVISPTLVGSDKAKDKILPKTSQTYTFYATVNNGTQYSDVAVQVIKWDFSAQDFQRVLGSIKVPSNYTGLNKTGQTFTYNNATIKVDFDEVFNFSLDQKNKIKIKMGITNNGTRSVSLPALKYYLLTEDNTMYQMVSSQSDNLTLQPKIKVNSEISAEIPSSLVSEKMQVLFAYAEDGSKLEIPVTSYKLSLLDANKEQQSDNVPAGSEKTVLIGDYKYGLTLQSVQRLPWEDDDILSATVTVTNKNNEAAPIPNITGVFYLDKVKLKEDNVKKLQVNNLVAIPVNGKAEFLIYTKIPYNNTMSTLGLELINNVDTGSTGSEKVKLLSFEVKQNAFKPITKVNVDSGKKNNTLGKSSTTRINSLHSYSGNNTKVFNVLVEVQNDERRMTNLSTMTGYLKTTNQSYFPVKISEVKEKISPSGKALYSVSAKLPSVLNTSGMTLVLGDLIDEGTAFSNVTEYVLPLESNLNVTSDLKKIDAYPYSLDINTVKISLSSNATVKFQYTLTKEQIYEVVPEGHSIIMELVDDKTKASYSKEFKLEQDLQLGTKEATMVAEMNIENPVAKIQEQDGFTLNVYDQFEGHKKLLSSRRVLTVFID